MFVSIIIPAFNERDIITQFIREIEKVLQKCRSVTESEIIIIDDHSTDGTFSKISALHIKNIKIYRLSRRSGSHIALRAGLSVAKGDYALCLSADGQDDPNVLSKMLKKCEEGADVVWALRSYRKEPFAEKAFAVIFYKILKLFSNYEKEGINLANADFYLLNRKVINAINSCHERNSSLFGLILWLGYTQDSVIYNRRKRLGGYSKWSLEAKMRLANNWIIAFSGIPLRLISITGFILAFAGIAYAVFIMFYALLGYSKPGWAETIIITLVINGLQMIMLGVMGEYLWKNLDESRNRPLFFIEKTTESI